MENIDLLSSVLKLEVGGNCWRQQQLHSAWVLSLEFEKAFTLAETEMIYPKNVRASIAMNFT